MTQLKVLFLGSDTFSALSLRGVLASPHVSAVHVVTPADARATRRNAAIRAPPLRHVAQHSGIDTSALRPHRPFDAWAPPAPFHTRDAAHVLVASSFGILVPPHIIDLFPHTINVHPSLLPRHRGPAPIQWTLANQDTSTGVSLVTLSKLRFDRGNLLAQKKYPHPIHNATYPALHDELGSLSATMITDALHTLGTSHSLPEYPQPDTGASFAPKVTSALANVSWHADSALCLYARQRAFAYKYPLVCAFAHRPIKLIDVAPCAPHPGLPAPGAFALTGDNLVVRCAHDSFIAVPAVQPANKPVIPARSWFNGARSKHLAFSDAIQ